MVEVPFTCSVTAVFKFSNRMPLIYACTHALNWLQAVVCGRLSSTNCFLNREGQMIRYSKKTSLRCAWCGELQTTLMIFDQLFTSKRPLLVVVWGSPPPCETRWRLLEKPLAFAPRTATLQHARAAGDDGKDA